MEKAAKEELFRELYQLDRVSDKEDSSKAAVIFGRSRILSTTKVLKERAPREASPHSDQSLDRVVPAVSSKEDQPSPILTKPQRDTSLPDTSSRIPTAPTALQNDRFVNQFTTTAGSKIMTKPSGKRKREKPVVKKPEAQQLFRGLSFFFVPNNDIAGPRKFRIRKALEFGAVWVRQWGEHITHIIVDNDLNYGHVLQTLEISSLPPGISLVTENYPSDCLVHGYVVNPNIEYYRVEGHVLAPAVQPAQSSPVSAASSGKSLEVKRTRLEEEDKSTLRAESSRQDAPGSPQQQVSNPAIDHPQDRLSCVLPDEPENVLDRAIEEAKAFQDLVSHSHFKLPN